MATRKEQPRLGVPVQRKQKVKPMEYEKPVKIGDKGPVVQYVALWLAQKGSTIKPTSEFHIGMRAAVVKFQKANSLKETGVVDKKTWVKLTAK